MLSQKTTKNMTSDGSIGLTAFDQHPYEIAAAAARRYLKRINQIETDGLKGEIIIPDLIIRQSTRAIFAAST